MPKFTILLGEWWYLLYFSASFKNIAFFWNGPTFWLVICYQLKTEISVFMFRVEISNRLSEQVIRLTLNVEALPPQILLPYSNKHGVIIKNSFKISNQTNMPIIGVNVKMAMRRVSFGYSSVILIVIWICSSSLDGKFEMCVDTTTENIFLPKSFILMCSNSLTLLKIR
jgi:hypothetical protein